MSGPTRRCASPAANVLQTKRGLRYAPPIR